MNEPQNTKPDKSLNKPEFVDEIEDMEIGDLFPKMNVNEIATSMQEEKECIVGDEELLMIYREVLDNCRSNESQIDEVLLNFLEMVMNEGDASSASKEAIVNLLKTKSDIADKKSKIADLMTRIKLKEKDTFPRYLAAQQNNKVVIESGKREMIKSINKLKNSRAVKNDK